MKSLLEPASVLGKKTSYPSTYDPSLLFPIPRAEARQQIRIPEPLPFEGADRWVAYEVSWLNLRGKPEVAIGSFSFSADSEFLIESKSFKLYLNSYNQTRCTDSQEVELRMKRDLEKAVRSIVEVELSLPSQFVQYTTTLPIGYCLDSLDLAIDTYEICPSFLQTGSDRADETLYTDLFRSNCPMTGQPDWSSIVIQYRGLKIDHPALLPYLISYRNHQGFIEQCVERIFLDLLEHCRPEALLVYAPSTRRGGVEITPCRTKGIALPAPMRFFRQ